MILDNYNSEELLHETFRDWKEELEKLILKKRKEEKKKLSGRGWIFIQGYHTTKRGNRWYYSNGLGGDKNKPKCWNYMHISARGAKNRFILLRGIRTARENKSGHGYLVVVSPHVVQRIKERAGHEGSTEEVLQSIFQYREVGIYYEHQWKTTTTSALPVTLPEEGENLWWNNRKSDPTIQIIMRTSLGIFLGTVSQDRGVVELRTFITDLTEEQQELVDNFLTPVWKYYNADSSEIEKLQNYMKDKPDRKVYLLGD